MLNLKQRDRRLLRFINDFGLVSCRQIHRLFFSDVSLRRCQDRLASIVKGGRLKRFRESQNTDYLYYVGKKPTEIYHMLLRVDSYIYFDQHYQLTDFVPEYKVGDVHADAYLEIYRNGFVTPYFLEVQLSPYFRQDKYETLYNSGAWLDRWDEFPAVIIESPHQLHLKSSAVRYIIGGKNIA